VSIVQVYGLTQAEGANRQSFADQLRHTARQLRSDGDGFVEDIVIAQEFDDEFIWTATVAIRRHLSVVP
jgi:hypothetical protein